MSQEDVSRLNKRNKTAIVDGKELDADKAAQVHDVKNIFQKLQRAMKQIALYRHNTERYAEYLEDTFSALSDALTRHGQLSLRVTATTYEFGGAEVLVDESRENNLCYPFYAHGIRLLMFNPGITPEELLRFLHLIMSTSDANPRQEDFITRLWKAELASIQYVVVEGFKVVDEEDADQVEMEVEKVVAYLYRQLQGNTDDIVRFARVAEEDLNHKFQDVDQMRGAVISGETATPADKERMQKALADEESNKLLPKMVVILFQVLELVTDDHNFEDVVEAQTQLLDAMLLSERFDVISQILDRFKHSLAKNLRPDVKTRVKLAEERFVSRMGEAQRIQSIAQVFNHGALKDAPAVRAYLLRLGPDALPPLLDALERVELPPNRRVMCDALVELARPHPQVIAQRLQHPSSNVVKDMLYILDRINPPGKLEMFAAVLEHPNVVLRLETINTLGRNPSGETWPHILKCLRGQDAQMRLAAARVAHFFEPDWVAGEAMRFVTAEDFPKRDRNEQRVLLGLISQVNHPKCQEHVHGILGQKGNLFNRSKVEEHKLLMVESLALHPALPTFQALAALAKDPAQPKSVQDAARDAATEMKTRLLSARGAQA